ALEHEVDFTREHPTLAYQRLRPHEFLEGDEIGLSLACQMHHREDRDFVTELLLVEKRPVALDIAGLFQRTNAPKTWRRRNSNAARQLHICDSPVRLQLLEDFAVNGVETGGHRT